MVSALLLLPQSGLRLWHKNLIAALKRDGVQIWAEARLGPSPPPATALLDELERLLLARRGCEILAPEPPGDWMRPAPGAVDFTFDLTGSPTAAAGSIFPIFDGVAGDLARDSALLSGVAPRLGLAVVADGRLMTLARARIALESLGSLRRGRVAVAQRLTTLIRAAARRDPLEAAPDDEISADAFTDINDAPPAASSAAAFLTHSLIAKARARLNQLIAHEGHWRVAWRRLKTPADSVQARLDWPTAGAWTLLADDRRRYFADPFLFERDGIVHVFCEEYPYATGKGIISHFQLDADGRANGAPRVVLERPYHLSYPLVFQIGDDIWMMPESSAARCLELYRADPFPVHWTRERVLIDDIAISDATFFEKDGRFWLTGATSEDNGSSWDCLSLFTGDSPLAPWTRCGAGPVLIDAAAARPAGHLFKRDGALWRPAQDCTHIYGGGLSLCRIDALDENGLRQSTMRRLGPPPGLEAEGAHTLNVGGGFETIDFVGARRKRG